eukprot:scaffold10095_cov163-Amphora_coffeaeformis.AAC.9
MAARTSKKKTATKLRLSDRCNEASFCDRSDWGYSVCDVISRENPKNQHNILQPQQRHENLPCVYGTMRGM